MEQLQELPRVKEEIAFQQNTIFAIKAHILGFHGEYKVYVYMLEK